MKVKSQKDFWSGLMFIVVGVAFAWGSLNYSFGSSARPGPAYFPFGLGVLMSILGGMVLFKALTVETDDGEPVGAFAWKPLLIILGSIAMFGFLLPRLGMLITLPLLVILSASASDEFKLKEAVLNAVILTAASYLIFFKGLSLTIPMWPTVFGA
ncbi:tripartite tricarboxylate transporter TctB family protein [Sphaerotilus hippei]|uniref:Tripartite tricarboxylate transporter TctB family protein n=1 Tax=Sphaerotilus hippei TaxID=744406 RepID=A0A318H5P3_9BURK|nr:tripartite tricarboxylate transporter TctB family protein [Sphaerotilus hippei]PXW98777.1 tripartite tricarboxylate transporter TctB family protein [Sphaerotilus hippei]